MCLFRSLPHVVSSVIARLLLQGFVGVAVVKAADHEEEATTDWPVPPPGIDGAYPDCPCAHLKGNMSLESLFSDSLQTEDGLTFISRTTSASTYRLPLDYGANRCSDWDADGFSFPVKCKAAAERQPWCDAKWCYVNTTICQRYFKGSSILPGLSYSYQACGYLDHYLSPEADSWNSSIPFYAFSFGHTPKEDPQTGAKFMDMFIEYAKSVLTEAGIPLDSVRYRRTLSAAARRTTSSTYTGCVREVALGNIDICLGDIWDTEERQAFGVASFIPVAAEKMSLLGPLKEDKEDILDMLHRPFLPFDGDLWLMVVGVVILVAVLMMLFEYGRPGSDFGEDQRIYHNLITSLYLATSSAVNAGVGYTCVTASGRAIAVGYGLFILIGVASFTAETARVLIQNSVAVDVNGIDMALEQNRRICYSAGMQSRLESYNGRMKQLGVPIDSADFYVFVEYMNSGKCDYSVMGEFWPDMAWERGEHCNFHFIGSPIMDFPTGYWVRDEYRARFMWAVSALRVRGGWAELKSKYGYGNMKACKEDSGRRLKSSDRREARRGRRLIAPQHTGDGGSDDGGTDVESMKASSMLGTVCLLGFTIIIACSIRCVEMMCFGLSEEDKQFKKQVDDQSKVLEDAAVKLLDHSAEIVTCFARHESARSDQLSHRTKRIVAHAHEIMATYCALSGPSANGIAIANHVEAEAADKDEVPCEPDVRNCHRGSETAI